MNGAAVNCQEEQALNPQHNDSSSLHSPGYLQTNYPCQEKNSQHHYSKEMNYNLLPDNFSVDGSSKHSQYIDSFSSEGRNRLSNSGDIWNKRIDLSRIIREPLELPVPKFEIDEHSVGVFTYKKDKRSSIEDSKDLDLDTRIDLLIKSKALSGMHPIFSDLNESGDSSTDSEESYSDLKHKPLRHDKISPPEKHVIHQESFDDPEKPLSRPPSPFLSRATYLFWFNKAIELKQQAKAQEQALLEKATKKLNQGNLSSGKVSETRNSKQGGNLLKSLLSELSKELKESVKQDFIKEIIENTVLNSLEDWWITERKLEENHFSKDLSAASSTNNDNFQSKDWTKTNEPAKFHENVDNISQDHRSTSPKGLFPLNEMKNQKLKKKLTSLEKQVTSSINELNKTLIKEHDADVLEELTDVHKSVLLKEIDYLENKNCNENVNAGGLSIGQSNPLNPEKIVTNNSVNGVDGTSDNQNANTSNKEVFIEKSIGNFGKIVKSVLSAPVVTEESNNHQNNPSIENVPIPGKSVIKSGKENILLEMEQAESSGKSDKGLNTLEHLEESGLSSEDLSIEKEKKEENFFKT